MTSDRPVFLVGAPRSGTTLFSAMLHAHPRIAMPPETRFLIPAYERRQRFGDLREAENRRRLARWMTRPRATKFEDLRIDRRAVIRAIVDAPPTFGSAAGVVWREFALSRGKQRWGEKRPVYWRYLSTVLRLFPDAQIIHLIRDGRSVVASLNRMPWFGQDQLGAIGTWALADHEMRLAGRRLPADAYHAVRYEDVLRDPRRELTAVCTFLGEAFHEGMLDQASSGRDVVPEPKNWFALVGGDLDTSRIDAWRSALDREQVGLIETVLGRALKANGYELSGTGTRPSPRAVAEYYANYSRSRAAMYKWRAGDALRRRHDANPLPAQLTSGQLTLARADR